MAALLNIVDLRRHTCRTNFIASLVWETSHPDQPRPPCGGSYRPRFVAARWHMGAEGRPVCSWSVLDGPEVRASPG